MSLCFQVLACPPGSSRLPSWPGEHPMQREKSPLTGSNKCVLTPYSFPRAAIVSGHGRPNCRWVFGWRGSCLLPCCSHLENCTWGYCQLAVPKAREAAPRTLRWLRSRLGAAGFAPDMLCHLLKLLLASTAVKMYLSARNARRKLKCFSSFLIKVEGFSPKRVPVIWSFE